MWQRVLQAGGGGSELKVGTFTGDGTNSITLNLEDNFDDVKLFSASRTSTTGSASAVTGFIVSSNGDKYAFVNSGSQQGTMNTGITYSSNGKRVTFTTPVSYKFINGLAYKFYYVV